jgi:hypothetical protein
MYPGDKSISKRVLLRPLNTLKKKVSGDDDSFFVVVLKNYEAKGLAYFFKRAHEFLKYLNDQSDADLCGVSILKNDTPLREALFKDLDRCWQVYEGANQIRQLHAHWTGTSINLNMRLR